MMPQQLIGGHAAGIVPHIFTVQQQLRFDPGNFIQSGVTIQLGSLLSGVVADHVRQGTGLFAPIAAIICWCGFSAAGRCRHAECQPQQGHDFQAVLRLFCHAVHDTSDGKN